jgi:hypothetical protein
VRSAEDSRTVGVRIIDVVKEDDPVQILGVYTGTKCHDSCYRRCFNHQIPYPYAWRD